MIGTLTDRDQILLYSGSLSFPPSLLVQGCMTFYLHCNFAACWSGKWEWDKSNLSSPKGGGRRAWEGSFGLDKRKWKCCVWLFATPWTVALRALCPWGFPRQECSSGLPFPSPRDLPYPGMEPESPALQADSLPSEPPRKPLRQKDRPKERESKTKHLCTETRQGQREEDKARLIRAVPRRVCL